MKTRRKQKSLLGRVLLWAVLLVILAAGGVSLYGYLWVQKYLKGPGFGAMVARELGEATKSHAELEGFTWSDPNAYVSSAMLTPRQRQGWSQIKADSLEASLDWSQVRAGVWSIPEVRLGSLELDIGTSAKVPLAVPDADADTPPAASAPAWLKRWLPKRTEIGEVAVENFRMLPGSAAGLKVDDMQLTAKPGSGSASDSWTLRGRQGTLSLPGVETPFRMSSINARLDAESLNVNDASATWIGDCEITSRGVLPFGKETGWKFDGRLSRLDVSHVLSPTWTQKVSGVAAGDYEVTPTGLKGKIEIKNGVVQNMPVLERVADFTRTERFRRLVFDIATADVEYIAGGTTKVTHLVLQSNGLLRMEGGFTTKGGRIDGVFDVGVTADALRWIPGSQSRVFTETRPGSPGLVWTTVKVSGPIEQPQEDLSNRLQAALGKALIIDAPMEAVGKGVETGVGVGSKVIESGAEALQGAPGKAVESGIDALKGLVPLFGK